MEYGRRNSSPLFLQYLFLRINDIIPDTSFKTNFMLSDNLCYLVYGYQLRKFINFSMKNS